jgi:tight adherence protein B
MSITPFQIFLLSGAMLCLLGLAFSGVLLSRAQTIRERRQERLNEVVLASRGAIREEAYSVFTPPTGERLSFFRKVARIFGFDPEKTALYPIKWWLILSMTLAIALGSRSLTTEFLGAGSTLAVPVIWIGMCRSYFGWIEGRRRSLLLQQFPDALAMIVRAIRVGIPVMEGMRIVSRESPGPTAGEFGRMVDQIAIGSSLEDAVLDLARRSGLPEYKFFATALALQNQTGGTLSDTLEGLADVIRKRAALKARGKALTAEARSSALILACLPFVTGGMLYMINPPYMMMLFVEPSGRRILGMAVVSLTIGLLTIRAIIRKSLPQ